MQLIIKLFLKSKVIKILVSFLLPQVDTKYWFPIKISFQVRAVSYEIKPSNANETTIKCTSILISTDNNNFIIT